MTLAEVEQEAERIAEELVSKYGHNDIDGPDGPSMYTREVINGHDWCESRYSELFAVLILTDHSDNGHNFDDYDDMDDDEKEWRNAMDMFDSAIDRAIEALTE